MRLKTTQQGVFRAAAASNHQQRHQNQRMPALNLNTRTTKDNSYSSIKTFATIKSNNEQQQDITHNTRINIIFIIIFWIFVYFISFYMQNFIFFGFIDKKNKFENKADVIHDNKRYIYYNEKSKIYM